MHWTLLLGGLATTLLSAGLLAMNAQTPPTKKGYLVVQATVTDPDQYARYTQRSPDLIARYGGRFLARGGRTETLEGPPGRGRVVIIEFPSFEQARAFYHSPEYQEARKLREHAGEAQFVLVEGQ